MQNAPVTSEHTLGEENRRVEECLFGVVVLMGRKMKFTHTYEIERSLWHVNSCTGYLTMQGNGHKVVFYVMNCKNGAWAIMTVCSLSDDSLPWPSWPQKLDQNTLYDFGHDYEYLVILHSLHIMIVFLLWRTNGPWLLSPSHHRLQVLFTENTFLHLP